MGGFGISDPEDLFRVRDVQLIRQHCTAITVKFDDVAVADFFDEQVDQGLRPEQFGRIWIHTHPGECPLPSAVDEETFERCFGACDWGVMFILARNEATFAELRQRNGGLRIPMQVQVESPGPIPNGCIQVWDAEYDQQVIFQEPCLEESWLDDLFDVREGWPLDDASDPAWLFEARTFADRHGNRQRRLPGGDLEY
ncbi:hypothetical protein SH661x_002869 [Planctomicrobium sp. SH661]|uniref:hypothetical protein n=1 Tax=Planctomicrobium sp. SH661 TaxID=3448124 RepID=UPI003F5B0B44